VPRCAKRSATARRAGSIGSSHGRRRSRRRNRRRSAYLFETSIPGVFAVGDVRANIIKRVASAVGEGSICIQLVHKVLAE
jgi:thioredoxin reductase (NADPH)